VGWTLDLAMLTTTGIRGGWGIPRRDDQQRQTGVADARLGRPRSAPSDPPPSGRTVRRRAAEGWFVAGRERCGQSAPGPATQRPVVNKRPVLVDARVVLGVSVRNESPGAM